MHIQSVTNEARSRRTQSQYAIPYPSKQQPLRSPLSRNELRRIVAEMLG